MWVSFFAYSIPECGVLLVLILFSGTAYCFSYLIEFCRRVEICKTFYRLKFTKLTRYCYKYNRIWWTNLEFQHYCALIASLCPWYWCWGIGSPWTLVCSVLPLIQFLPFFLVEDVVSYYVIILSPAIQFVWCFYLNWSCRAIFANRIGRQSYANLAFL